MGINSTFVDGMCTPSRVSFSPLLFLAPGIKEGNFSKAWFPYDHNSDCFHMSPTDRGHVAEASPTVTIIWTGLKPVVESVTLWFSYVFLTFWSILFADYF